MIRNGPPAADSSNETKLQYYALFKQVGWIGETAPDENAEPDALGP
jgi:hypothetical protein